MSEDLSDDLIKSMQKDYDRGICPSCGFVWEGPRRRKKKTTYKKQLLNIRECVKRCIMKREMVLGSWTYALTQELFKLPDLLDEAIKKGGRGE